MPSYNITNVDTKTGKKKVAKGSVEKTVVQKPKEDITKFHPASKPQNTSERPKVSGASVVKEMITALGRREKEAGL